MTFLRCVLPGSAILHSAILHSAFLHVLTPVHIKTCIMVQHTVPVGCRRYSYSAVGDCLHRHHRRQCRALAHVTLLGKLRHAGTTCPCRCRCMHG